MMSKKKNKRKKNLFLTFHRRFVFQACKYFWKEYTISLPACTVNQSIAVCLTEQAKKTSIIEWIHAHLP